MEGKNEMTLAFKYPQKEAHGAPFWKYKMDQNLKPRVICSKVE